MDFITILLSLFKVIIYFFIILGIIWLILPYIFRFFVAPKFDGSYKYNSSDFEKDKSTPKKQVITFQDNNFKFDFNKNTYTYMIKFGEDRILANGVIRIKYNKKWYSSNPAKSEKRLIFIEFKQVDEIKNEFELKKNDKSNIKIYCIKWKLEDVDSNKIINVWTYFEVYNNVFIEVKEPDLFNKVIEIENLNFIVFKIKFENELIECSNGNFNEPIFEFPCFLNKSPNKRTFTYKNGIFFPPRRHVASTNAPRIFFDDNLNTFLISSLDEFIIHINKYDLNSLKLSFGLNGEIKQVPQGYTSSCLILFSKGIRNSFELLGDLLRKYHQKERKSMYMDNIVSYLGYWTDNGSYYYYNPIKNKTLSETLIEVKNHLEKLKVPIKYYNIDSWWYIKEVAHWKRKLLGNLGRILGGGLYGGTITWEPDPNYMHESVDQLSKDLNNVFVAHNRWFSSKTIYQKDFNFYIENGRAICLDESFWDLIMQNCQKWNIITYEQDWMHNQFESFSILRNEVYNVDKWLKVMSMAAKKYNRTIQYCMSNPGMILTSVKLDNVSYARTSGDYHPRWPRIYDYRFFTQTNLLAYGLRLWPFKDVFRSTCEGRINGEKQPELMALVSCLSCGPVGFGDKIGKVGVDILAKTCRTDGLLIKPDAPLRVTDRMFIPHNKYYISYTYSDFGLKRWYYVLINKLKIKQPKDKTFKLEDIDANENKYIVFDYFKKTISVIDKEKSLVYNLKGQDYKYLILAPILQEGFSIIGDISKFVPINFKTFKSINKIGNKYQISIENILDETMIIYLYNQNKIKKILLDNSELAINYPENNQNSELCFVKIEFNKNYEKMLEIELFS